MDPLTSISCAINAALGGDPSEKLCSRVVREERAAARWWLDAAFWCVNGEPSHCLRCYAESGDAGL